MLRRKRFEEIGAGHLAFAGRRSVIMLNDADPEEIPERHSMGSAQLYTLHEREDLPAILERLIEARRTGRLDLRYDAGNRLGTIYCQNGEIYYASFTGWVGRDALLGMANAGTGDLVFHPDATTDTTNVGQNGATLLQEMRNPPAPTVLKPTFLDEPVSVPSSPPHGTAALDTVATADGEGGGDNASRLQFARWLALAALLLVIATIPVWLKLFNRPPLLGTAIPATKENADYAQRRLAVRLEELNSQIPANSLLDVKLRRTEVVYDIAQKVLAAGDVTEAISLFRQLDGILQALTSLNQEREGAADVRDLLANAINTAAAGKIPLPKQIASLFSEVERLKNQGQDAYDSGLYPKAISSWGDARKKLDHALENRRSYSAYLEAERQFKAQMEGLEENLVKEFDEVTRQKLSELRKSAIDNTSKGLYQEAAADLIAAAQTIPRAAETAEATRRRIEMSSLFRNGLNQMANRQWGAAVTSLEMARTVPGYAEDKDLLGALNEAKAGVIVLDAMAAKATGKWDLVKTRTEQALALFPTQSVAIQLRSEALYNLTPRLALTAEADGKLVQRARITFGNGKSDLISLPFSIPGRPMERIAFELDAADMDRECLAPATLDYQFPTAGRQDVKVSFRKLTAPSEGRLWRIPELNLFLRPVPAGSFLMGSDAGPSDERPVHKVTFTRPFWVAEKETTNLQYRAFLRQTGYSGRNDASDTYLRHFTRTNDMPVGDDFPVCYVSWKNAEAFCAWLNERERLGRRIPAGYAYRLPTEAEWEYACRDGVGGDGFPGALANLGWFRENSTRMNQKGGQKLGSKNWHINDLYGNVWEWCHDWEAPYNAGAVTDPAPSTSGMYKVVRGGSWDSDESSCRASNRHSMPLVRCDPNLGFRVVLAPILRP